MVWVPLANGEGQVVKGIKLKNPETGKTHTVASSSRKGINRYEITFEDGSKVFNHDIRKKKDSPGWEVVGRFHTPEEIAHMYGRSKVDPDANQPRPMRASFWKMKSKPGTHNYKQKKKLMNDPVYIKKFSQFFKDTLDEESQLDEKGLWDNIHAKRGRIKNGSGEHMRRPGEEGRPTKADFKASQNEEVRVDESLDKGADMVDIVRGDMSVEDGLKKYSKQDIKAGIKAINRFSPKLKHDALKEETLEEGPKDAAGKDVFVKKIAKSAGVGYKAAGAIAAAAGRKRLGKEGFQKKVEAGQKAAAAARAKGKKYTGEHD